jgi:hypothetical protein
MADLEQVKAKRFDLSQNALRLPGHRRKCENSEAAVGRDHLSGGCEFMRPWSSAGR